MQFYVNVSELITFLYSDENYLFIVGYRLKLTLEIRSSQN